MLLQLSHFPPFIPLCPALPLPPAFPHLGSGPWVIEISSLASTFPILFLTSPCIFYTYHFCILFPLPLLPSPPATSTLITLHVISISGILSFSCFQLHWSQLLSWPLHSLQQKWQGDYFVQGTVENTKINNTDPFCLFQRA